MVTYNKYFIPKISDIHIGLKYEYKTLDGARHSKDYMDNLPWKQGIIENENDIPYVIRTLIGRMVTEDNIECIRVLHPINK